MVLPGVHSAAAPLDGKPLLGDGFDRTHQYAARNQRIAAWGFASEETVEFSQIPCWPICHPP
jgi:hypothetical protein